MGIQTVMPITNWLLHHSSFVITLIVIIFLCLALSAIVEGLLDFNQLSKRPREAMSWCHKHGAFPKKYALELFPELQGKVDGAFVCPTCYKESVFDNVNKRLNYYGK